jgi:hypothetical protein
VILDRLTPRQSGQGVIHVLRSHISLRTDPAPIAQLLAHFILSTWRSKTSNDVSRVKIHTLEKISGSLE